MADLEERIAAAKQSAHAAAVAFVVEVRRYIGDGHERFSDDDIRDVAAAMSVRPHPAIVARKIGDLWREEDA